MPDDRGGSKQIPPGLAPGLASGLEVRAATASDRAACIRLLTARLDADGVAHDPDGVARAVELALAQSSSAWLVIATTHALPAGVLLANPIVSAARGGAALWVEEIYVAPEKRRRGIGRALLQFAAEEARRNGMRTVEIEAPASSDLSALWLARLAFTPTGKNRYSCPA